MPGGMNFIGDFSKNKSGTTKEISSKFWRSLINEKQITNEG